MRRIALRQSSTLTTPPTSTNDDMAAEAIARKAMAIAAEICIYTNHNVIVESLES